MWPTVTNYGDTANSHFHNQTRPFIHDLVGNTQTRPQIASKHRTRIFGCAARVAVFHFRTIFFFRQRSQRETRNTYVDRRSSDPDHSLRCGQPHSAHNHKFSAFTIFHCRLHSKQITAAVFSLTAQRQGCWDWTRPSADWPRHVAGATVGARLAALRGAGSGGCGRRGACVRNPLPTCSPPVPLPQDTCF